MVTTTITVPSGISSADIKPEFFPLPKRGHDRFFGLGRTSYYDLEKSGMIRLVRIRKTGNQRGKVLIPYQAMLDLVHKLNPDLGRGAV